MKIRLFALILVVFASSCGTMIVEEPQKTEGSSAAEQQKELLILDSTFGADSMREEFLIVNPRGIDVD